MSVTQELVLNELFGMGSIKDWYRGKTIEKLEKEIKTIKEKIPSSTDPKDAEQIKQQLTLLNKEVIHRKEIERLEKELKDASKENKPKLKRELENLKHSITQTLEDRGKKTAVFLRKHGKSTAIALGVGALALGAGALIGKKVERNKHKNDRMETGGAITQPSVTESYIAYLEN